jgi:prevent-host-death family protein
VNNVPNIRPISDLRNKANDISEFCHTEKEPVFITKNGVGDMVIMSIEVYERQQALLTLYTKLAEVESEIATGDEGEDFLEVARKLRNSVHGKV